MSADSACILSIDTILDALFRDFWGEKNGIFKNYNIYSVDPASLCFFSIMLAATLDTFYLKSNLRSSCSTVESAMMRY